MAAEKKRPNLQFTLPLGPLVYPSLTTPNRTYKKEFGEYNTKVRYPADGAEVEYIKNMVAAEVELAGEEAKKAWAELPVDTRKKFAARGIKGPVWTNFISDEYDKETEELTGFVTISARTDAGGIAKKGTKDERLWTFTLPLFDSSGKLIKKMRSEVWGGTQAELAVEVRRFWVPKDATYGIRFKLNAVCIRDLKTGGGRDAEGYGFKSDGEGFIYGGDDEDDGEEAEASVDTAAEEAPKATASKKKPKVNF